MYTINLNLSISVPDELATNALALSSWLERLIEKELDFMGMLDPDYSPTSTLVDESQVTVIHGPWYYGKDQYRLQRRKSNGEVELARESAGDWFADDPFYPVSAESVVREMAKIVKKLKKI